MVTLKALERVLPRVPHLRAVALLPFLNAALEEFEITTPRRIAAFLAQIGHESAHLRHFEEVWGPTAAQLRYQTHPKLGNVLPGDGERYKGRGPIQLTGRGNYRLYGRLLGIDLENNPRRASDADVGFRVAGLYWQRNGLNTLADAGDFVGITKRINGGLNGYDDRNLLHMRALDALGVA